MMTADRPDEEWWRKKGRHLLRKELDRGSLSQQAFADLMRERAPVLSGTSLRSLVNYLQGETRPTSEWLTVAAGILRVRSEWLASGEEPRQNLPYSRGGMGLRFDVSPKQVKTSDGWVEVRDPCINVIVHTTEEWVDLPMAARNVMRLFLWDYCRHVGEISNDEAARLIQRHFQSLLTGGSRLPYAQAVALALSLAASAYIVTDITPED
jgi:hypothetical protein